MLLLHNSKESDLCNSATQKEPEEGRAENSFHPGIPSCFRIEKQLACRPDPLGSREIQVYCRPLCPVQHQVLAVDAGKQGGTVCTAIGKLVEIAVILLSEQVT